MDEKDIEPGSELAPEESTPEEQNTGRRLFSRAERFVLQAASGGRCEACGADLSDGFHADHRFPFAAGGMTDLANAQALCPRCNRRKGARITERAAEVFTMEEMTIEEMNRETMNTDRLDAEDGGMQNLTDSLTLSPWTLPLRPWQQVGVQVWHSLRAGGERSLTVTATPGSGKTALALFLAHEEFRSGRADLLVVVVPTRTLKVQWAQAAHRAGLHLTADWGNNAVAPPADTHGCIVTYAQVAALPEALRLLCVRRRVVAVLDEIHHCATSRTWGDALHQALEHAVCRFCLSGTAWRTDGASIPFVAATAQGNSVSDVTYDYAQALADGVLREAFFFALEARLLWLDERGERTATFADALGERDTARRLRAALDPQGDWLRTLLERADAALTLARPGHPQAKGLAVAMDTAHARALAALLREVTGEAPLVALSDDPSSLATLERFRTGPCRWLVVCKMAGEGYDLPDIRVVAWATNLTSVAAFRQIVARALRVVPGLVHQDAQVFLPADGRLLAMARGLLGEQNVPPRLSEDLAALDMGGESEGNADRLQERGEVGLFVPLESRATGQSVVTGGGLLAASALAQARELRAMHPQFSAVPEHLLAASLARMDAEAATIEADAEGRDREWRDGAGRDGEAENAGDSPHHSPGDHSNSPSDHSHHSHHSTGSLPENAGNSDNEEQSYDDGQAYNDGQAYHDGQTYDQRRRHLRRICTRLTALIARELAVNPSIVHRAFHRSLGVRQAEATLAELELRKRLLEDKLRELRAV